MTTRVASILAEVGLDSSKFDAGLKGVLSGLASMKNGFSDIGKFAPIAGAAVVAFGKFAKDAIDDTVAYAKQVEDLSRLIGATPEEASKLIQAADDMRISYDSLSTAMEAAIRKGFDPSIAGLEKIRQKYQDIQDPIDKSKLLMDTFGRAGADMAPLLELPRNRLAELAAEADKVGLVMSGENLQKAKDYALAMDGLEDSVNGVKIKLGNELIPELTKFIDSGSDVEDTIDGQRLKWLDMVPVLGAVARAIMWINELASNEERSGKVANYNPYADMPDYEGGVYGDAADLPTTGTRFNTPVNGVDAASGADFIVPPGFGGDTFRVNTSSGEHVQVTPAGQTSGSNAELLREIKGLRKDILKTAFGMGAQ